MTKHLHLVLKFPVDFKIAGGTTNTIKEHKLVFETKNRLIWGQFSEKDASGVSDKNRKRIINQVDAGINSFAFFLANNGGERELFVGKIHRLYDRKEISATSPLKDFIPGYYSVTVGTPAEKISVFVDVSTFLKIDSKLIDEIIVESSGKSVVSKSSTPVFLVNISENLQDLINEMLANPEANFQYQVEQEGVGDDITIDDQPKDVPSKTTVGGRSSYKRDPKTSKKAIVLADYRCEIDSDHEDFISKVTKKNYVEAHHLIPMGFQDDFEKSIDVEANIVSLCVSCHKKLHHAEYKVIESLIEKLYDDRIGRLNDCKIKLPKDKLLNYYK
ncbi:restriction endonuclease [Bacillus toyonensis]|uniref:HNH endonuclease n=1 Tax=Bacillus toyonensis TaxID=155322 RepID=UPI000BF1D08E|nr:restriction endonuclease [Bacillus toyonensis]PEL42689.1 restriction endonuclease [Bacillus toyonensis]